MQRKSGVTNTSYSTHPRKLHTPRTNVTPTRAHFVGSDNVFIIHRIIRRVGGNQVGRGTTRHRRSRRSLIYWRDCRREKSPGIRHVYTRGVYAAKWLFARSEPLRHALDRAMVVRTAGALHYAMYARPISFEKLFETVDSLISRIESSTLVSSGQHERSRCVYYGKRFEINARHGCTCNKTR